MRVLRWTLLPVVCVSAWFVALLFAGFIVHLVIASFCSADPRDGGTCIPPWTETLVHWLMYFFWAFTAALIIAASYFTAPASRTVVAWVVFAAGAAYYAFWIVLGVSSAKDQFIPSGIGGLATVLLLTRGKDLFRRSHQGASQNA